MNDAVSLCQDSGNVHAGPLSHYYGLMAWIEQIHCHIVTLISFLWQVSQSVSLLSGSRDAIVDQIAASV